MLSLLGHLNDFILSFQTLSVTLILISIQSICVIKASNLTHFLATLILNFNNQDQASKNLICLNHHKTYNFTLDPLIDLS